MPDLRAVLKARFKPAGRVAILGVGSDLRADDGAGMLVAKSIDKAFASSRSRSRPKVFFGSTAPENLTGEIKRFKPEHLVLIDAIDIKEKPGTVLIVKPEEIGGVSFSTHKMPAEVLVNYFRKSCRCKVTIIGIQPKELGFGKRLSAPVKSSVKALSKALKHALGA